MYYKTIEDNILTAIGTSSVVSEPNVEITKTEYDNILSLIRNKPQDTEETVYKLVADTMTYEPFDAPPVTPVEEPNNDYGIPNEIYDSIIDEYTLMLIEEGVIE